MSIERYLPMGHEPHAQTVDELFYLAQSEFLAPYPSTPLKLFDKLNQMTGGLRAKEFTILCGATGTGKTTLCANLSLDLLEQGVPQFVASVETGPTDYIKRMISAMEEQDWNTGEVIPVDFLKFFNAKNGEKFKTKNFSLSLYEDRLPVETLMADIAWHVQNIGAKVAIIDNLNFFMEVTSARDQVVEMDRVIHELIIFCKQVPVHVIMVMHPKKTENTRVESELDIKGSSTAVQESHNVFLFNRPHPNLIKLGHAIEDDRELFIAKMRRRGKYVRRRLILETINSVRYKERVVV